MFTGIVEEVGAIVAISDTEPARVGIRGPLVTSDAKHGDSIAVNGVCLTVVDIDGDTFSVDAVAETLQRTSLRRLAVGGKVNLERAAAVGQRLGGHIVQGHVDGTGSFLGRGEDGVTRFAIPAELARFLVDKGSVTVDGVSLTVVDVTEAEFTVALIPTTLSDTILGTLEPGDPVNIEADVIAKYLDRLARPHLEAKTGGE